MTTPRTIDNLGVEVSTRYAEDKAILDETLIKEARTIPVQTGIEVTTPSFPSEMDALLHLQPTNATWAFFFAPPHYFEQRKPLFSFQLIPSMGSDDKKEALAQRILTILKDEKDQRGQKILTLFNTMGIFDKLIIEINSRRGQYQKG